MDNGRCFEFPNTLIYMRFFYLSVGCWLGVEITILAWGARGREFESRHADHLFLMKSTGYSFAVVTRFSLAAFLLKLPP